MDSASSERQAAIGSSKAWSAANADWLRSPARKARTWPDLHLRPFRASPPSRDECLVGGRSGRRDYVGFQGERS